MNRALFVFGNRTAQEIYEAAVAAHYQQFDSLQTMYFQESHFRSTLLKQFAAPDWDVSFVAGVADIPLKMQIVSICQSAGWRAFTVIHPAAVVSSTAIIGDGAFIGPCAVVSAGANVGEHSIVHIHASIGHDAKIGEYCAVLPGARISGNVQVGNRVLVGSNAFVNAGVEIGSDCQIDALTYVARSVGENMIVSARTAKPVPRLKKQD